MKKNMNKILVLLLLGLSIASAQNSAASPQQAAVQGNECQAFAETGQATCGRFLQYWQMNGGLEQQGFPISGAIGETSPTDGKVYTVQYFERAVFEYHPENQPPNDVQLSLLGAFRYQQKYPTGAPGQSPNTSTGSMLFQETGKQVGGGFLEYWQQHGGLAQQGFPISDEFSEKSDLDGQTYVVQYFERAVLEYHPELQTVNKVLLSQLGTFRHQQLSSAGRWVAPPAAVPPALVTPSPTPMPSATATPGEPTGQISVPSDENQFGVYVVGKHRSIGQCSIASGWVQPQAGENYIAIYVQDDTYNCIIHQATNDQLAEWGRAVTEDATVAWGNTNFEVDLRHLTVDQEPCSSCSSYCYGVGAYSESAGGYQAVYDLVRTRHIADVGDKLLVCREGVEVGQSAEPSAPQPTKPPEPPAPQGSQEATISWSGGENSAPFTLAGGTYKIDWRATNNSNDDSFALMLVLQSTKGASYYYQDIIDPNLDLGNNTGTNYVYNVPAGEYFIYEWMPLQTVQWSLTFTRQ